MSDFVGIGQGQRELIYPSRNLVRNNPSAPFFSGLCLGFTPVFCKYLYSLTKFGFNQRGILPIGKLN
jgi:hypothetical protein